MRSVVKAIVKNRVRAYLSRSPPLNGRLSSNKLITTGGPLYLGMVNDFLLFIHRFMNFISMHMLGCRRVASPCSRRGHNKFYAAQKFIPYENAFGQTWKKMGWSLVSYLLPLLVSAGIMHFARRIVKPPADGG